MVSWSVSEVGKENRMTVGYYELGFYLEGALWKEQALFLIFSFVVKRANKKPNLCQIYICVVSQICIKISQ